MWVDENINNNLNNLIKTEENNTQIAKTKTEEIENNEVYFEIL